MGMLPTELERCRCGCRSVAFKGRMVWESLVPARGGLGLVCRWLFGEGERRVRYCVRAKQIFPSLYVAGHPSACKLSFSSVDRDSSLPWH